MNDVEYPVSRVVEVIHRAQFTAKITTGDESRANLAIAALLQQQLMNVKPGDKTVVLNEDVARELNRVLG